LDLEEIKQSFLADDNSAFEYVYLEHGEYCISRIQQLRNCSEADAEDLFTEAVLIFRDKILTDQIEVLSSLRGYLFAVCENNFLARLKKEKSHKRKISDIEFFFYLDDMLNEDEKEYSESLQQATVHAWKTLSENCKDILTYFYLDKLRLDKIALLMGHATANVAKTTKARCYKHLMTEARKFYSKLQQQLK